MRSLGQCCTGHLSAKSGFLIMLEEWEPIGLSLTLSLYVSSNLASNSPLGMGSIQCKGSCTFGISHKPFLHSLTRGSDYSWYHYYIYVPLHEFMYNNFVSTLPFQNQAYLSHKKVSIGKHVLRSVPGPPLHWQSQRCSSKKFHIAKS